MTLTEISRRCGLSRQRLEHWERCEILPRTRDSREAETAKRIAAVLKKRPSLRALRELVERIVAAHVEVMDAKTQ